MKSILQIALTVIFGAILEAPASGQQPSIQLMAAKPSWVDGEFVGHAFMCISIPLRHGTKEDCFGFYPRQNGKGFISNPGSTVSEFRKNSSRFSKVTVSLRKSITLTQVHAIIGAVNDWDKKQYQLTNQSCIDFVDSVAHVLGWKTPPRTSTDLPETYLTKLGQANP